MEALEISDLLWEEAKKIFYDDVGETKGEKTKDATSLAETMESLRNASSKASREYGEHSVRKDKKPVITIKLGRIMQRLEIFMQMGDTYMSYAPETVSLVWMSFRMIFTGFLKDSATCEFLTDAVDQITDIMFVCNVFEKRYLKAQDLVDTTKAIKDRVLAQIPPLYATVLKFSFQSRKLFAHGKLTRSFMSWRSTELEDTLSDAQRKRKTLQDTAGIGFQEATLDALQGISVDISLIRPMSEILQNEIAPGIKSIQTEQARVKQVENREEIEKKYNQHLDWLNTGSVAEMTVPGRMQHSNREKTHKGSADWLLQSKVIESWQHSKGGGPCWLWGSSGFGKSFLVSSVIDHIEHMKDGSNTSKPHLVYFFCRKGDEATALGKKIFLHLLIQLYEKAATGNPHSSPDLQARFSQVLEETWKNTKTEEKQDATLLPMKAALLPAFQKLAKEIEAAVFVVVDGLDECTDYEEFIDALLSIPKKCSVHLLVSSRPEVYHQLREPVKYPVEVRAAQTQAEIKKYVISRVKGIKRFTPPMRKRACERIAEQSQGSFRYADVILESLNLPQAKMTPFNELIANLPGGMNALYRRSMSSLDPHLRRILIVALRWLMCSSGQITLDLIADELECRWDTTDYLDEDLEEYTDDDDVDYADYETDSEGTDSIAYGRQQTFFVDSGTHDRDIAKELRLAGRDFLVIDQDNFIDTQHNSIRDFILSEEELMKHVEERCAECKTRFQETIAFEAGPKAGNFIICKTILQRLNNSKFQKEHIILPADWKSTRIREDTRVAESSGSDSRDQEIVPENLDSPEEQGAEHESEDTERAKNILPSSSMMANHHPQESIPDVPDDHAVPSKEDIINHFEAGETATTAEDERQHLIRKGTESEKHSRSDYPALRTRLSSSRRSSFSSRREPFEARYELTYWPRHFRQLESVTSSEETGTENWKTLFDGLEDFLNRESEIYQHWLIRVHPWRKFAQFDSPLHVAARYGITTLLQRWKASLKHDINEKNENEDTPLHLACTGDGGFAGLELLCEMGADVNDQNDEGQTPLMMLLSYRAPPENIDILLRHGARPEISDRDGLTALHWAVGLPVDPSERLELARKFLQYDAVDVNAKDKISGETPLHWTFRRDSPPTKLLELLVQHGADVNAQDDDSQAPLYEACVLGDANGASFLIKHGADIDDDEDIYGRTALQAAIFSRNLETVMILINAGADLTLKDKAGHDALGHAVEVGDISIFNAVVDALVEKGLFQEKCLQQDSLDNYTPLLLAVNGGHVDIVDLLLKRGDAPSQLNIKARNGDTALHIAASRSMPELVAMLLDAGADPLEKDVLGDTAIDSAFHNWSFEIGYTLPTKFALATMLLLIEKAPDGLKQPFHLYADIETEIKTPTCSVYRHLRNQRYDYDWTPLAFARNMKRDWKVQALLDGAEDSEPTVIGLPPTGFDVNASITFPDDTPYIWSSEDHLEISTFRQDIPKGSIEIEPYEPYRVTSIITDNPVPACMPQYYFEVEILAAPEDANLYVGFAKASFGAKDRIHTYGWEMALPPWDQGNTHLMTSHDGRLLQMEPKYLEGYSAGDVIGCGFDWEQNMIFFTRNGERMPPAFRGIYGQIFPWFAIHNFDFRLRLNLGNDPALPFKCTDWNEGAAPSSICNVKLDPQPVVAPSSAPPSTAGSVAVTENDMPTKWEVRGWAQPINEELAMQMEDVIQIRDERMRSEGIFVVPELTFEGAREVAEQLRVQVEEPVQGKYT